jgi:hypothetical protein
MPTIDARRRIEELIRHGLLPLDQIAFLVSLDAGEDLDEDVLGRMVAECWQEASRVPMKSPTPLDRLQSAFDALDRAGIMARHYPDAGRSDANALIENELAVATRRGREYRGYCFYDEPLARLMSEGGLAFCFGPADMPATYAELWRQQVEIAHEIAGALQHEGFEVQWSGKAADVVGVVGVDWSGPRDASGAPKLPIGVQLEGKAAPRRRRDPIVPTNVFVACAEGTADAHRLITAIARASGSPMYGAVEQAELEPAAVAVQVDGGVLLDLVAGEAQAGPRGLMRHRDLVRDCSVLVVTAPDVGQVECRWWDDFEPERRVVVVTGGAGPERHDGSVVCAVDLGSGRGVDGVVRALANIGRRR